MRKNYCGDFKSKVALAALKGDRPLSELSSKYIVIPTCRAYMRSKHFFMK